MLQNFSDYILVQVFPQGDRQCEGGAGSLRLHRGQGLRTQIPALPCQVLTVSVGGP